MAGKQIVQIDIQETPRGNIPVYAEFPAGMPEPDIIKAIQKYQGNPVEEGTSEAKPASNAIDIAMDFVADGEKFEGTAYQDAGGVWTGGYGFTKGVKEGDTFDKEESLTRLRSELVERKELLNRYVKQPMQPHEEAAMLSLMFNVGRTAFRKSKALKAFNEGDKETFKKEAFDKDLGWTRVNGKHNDGLIKRREAEKHLFEGNEAKAYETLAMNGGDLTAG